MSEDRHYKPVYVVMGNDYPAAVFDTRDAAEAYCETRRQKDKADDERSGRKSFGSPRIYWRVYDFPLNKGVDD